MLSASRARKPLHLLLYAAMSFLPSQQLAAQSTAAIQAGEDATRATTMEPSLGAALAHLADRVGLWGSAGFGRASAGLRCAACANESTRAYALDGIVGVRLTPRFLMAAETFAWLDVFGGGVDRVSRGTYLSARLYPMRSAPLFLHGGAGVASFRIYDGTIGFTTRSPSLTLSGGYDWRVGNLTLTPTIAAAASTGGALRSNRTNNVVNENARLMMLRTSVAFSWYRR